MQKRGYIFISGEIIIEIAKETAGQFAACNGTTHRGKLAAAQRQMRLNE